MKKISSLLLVLLLVFQFLVTPVQAMASSNIKDTQQETFAIIVAENEVEVPVLDNYSDSSNLITTLRNGDPIIVLETVDLFSHVAIHRNDSEEILTGYIENKYLNIADDHSENEVNELENTVVENEDDDQQSQEQDKDISTENDELENKQNDDSKNTKQLKVQIQQSQSDIQAEQEAINVVTKRNPTNIRKTDSTQAEIVKKIDQGSIIEVIEYNENWYHYSDNQITGYVHKKHVENIVENPESLQGIGIRNPTNVRERASTRSQIKHSFPIGSIIDLKTFSSDWYEAFDEDGKHIGYIHHKHIGDIVFDNQDSFKGIGIKSPTNIRQLPSTKAKVAENRPIGDIINLKTFSQHWYEATNSSGKTIGYVHKNHIGDTVVTNQESLKGVGIKNPTNIRQLPSTQAKVAQKRPIGDIINLKTFSQHWYEATNSSGKTIGYVHKNHIGDTVVTNQESLKGVGIKNPTNIRQLPSTQAKVAQKRPIGDIINLKTFSKHWYEATDNKGNTIGYVHKNHIEYTFTAEQESLKGIGIKKPTNIRQLPSTQAEVAQKRPIGDIIHLKTFSNHWYQAVDQKGGHLGYVHHKHIGDILFTEQENFKGIAINNPTIIRALPSTQANRVISLAAGSVINVKSLSQHWYEASININGRAINGYIHRNHFNFLGRALREPTNIRESASTKVNVLETLTKGQLIELKKYNEFWYEVTVIVNGVEKTGYIHKYHVDTNPGQINTFTTNYDIDYNEALQKQMGVSPQIWRNGTFVDASRNQVDFYLNPSNFKFGQPEYYQFLVLSRPAGLNPDEVNEKILKNKGVLHNTAHFFNEAAQKYNINEAYLIAHALHETGNGTSKLAIGVPVDSEGNIVDPKKEKPAHIVYNMYGIGAYDDCPLYYGAKRALEEGWFTIKDAIIGGAKFIGEDYIHHGQDTLYKMRWNPARPATHQYATDVNWAIAQTTRISRIYSSLDNYLLMFDVPRYKNHPPASTYLQVTATALNMRTGPGTSNKSVGTVTNGTFLTPVLDNSNNLVKRNVGGQVWYQIYFNGDKLWVSGQYVRILP